MCSHCFVDAAIQHRYKQFVNSCVDCSAAFVSREDLPRNLRSCDYHYPINDASRHPEKLSITGLNKMRVGVRVENYCAATHIKNIFVISDDFRELSM